MYTIKSLNENEKLEKILGLFLLPDYTIPSTTYLDILLSHIEKAISNETCTKSDIKKSVLLKWVIEALRIWTENVKPCQPVMIFTIKLIGLISRSEFDFLYFYREGTLTTLCKTFALREENLSASVKMAYTSMLLELLNHKSGRVWITESGAWRDVIRFCHTNHTLYVTRESQKFIWMLLQLESEKKSFCEEVILVAAEPLINNTFTPQVSATLEDNYLDQNELLLTIIDLLTAIMENTLFTSMDNTIPQLVESATNLESRIKGLFETCISTKFFLHITKLIYLLIFMRLKEGISGPDGNVPYEVWRIFWSNVRYVDSMLLAKKNVLELIKGGKLILTYWKKLNNLCKLQFPDQYNLEHQVAIVMVMPLSGCSSSNRISEDLLEMFVQKLFNITCIYTQRLCYMIRDIMTKGDLPVEHICKVCIQLSLDILDLIDRDGAVIIFQVFSYTLKDFVQYRNGVTRLSNNSPPEIQTKREKADSRFPQVRRIFDGDPAVEYPQLLSTILDALATIIHKYKPKWQECVETINILTLAQELLKHPNIISKVCVKALTLCKLAIQNFMAPNLVLLVHSDSHMDEMGPVLFKRMHDPNWEVRDSVLEVINTIATISECKYPAFQDLLLINGFPQLIVDVAATDGESYVRASALICIITFVRINRIWDEKLCHLDLPKMAIEIMTSESEAIVRREAVTLVKELYVHRKWPQSTVDEMAKAMTVAAVLDLHWEVKVNALQFWSQFINAHLNDQGMLDGIFPNVTFSKEHRKIVVLDGDEIRRRISKALDKLASQNCLSVLLTTLEDDSDFQVCKTAGEIIKKLKEIVLTYKLSESEEESSSSKDFDVNSEASVTNDSQTGLLDGRRARGSEKHSAVPEDIINSIVDMDDMNLLASVYEHTMNMNPDAEPKNCEKVEHIPCVEKNQFLRSILGCDIDNYIEEKSRWLKTYTNSFGSVVDDILVAYESKNVNDMDCY